MSVYGLNIPNRRTGRAGSRYLECQEASERHDARAATVIRTFGLTVSGQKDGKNAPRDEDTTSSVQ